MALTQQFFEIDDLHPIDIVQDIAANQEWEFDRIADDQISMSVEGQWRTYSVTLAWSDEDETLRLICSFDMEPPEHRINQLNAALNRVNEQCWNGAFTHWSDNSMIVFRYGLILSGGQVASPDQIDTMISNAVLASERYYPAFQLVTWGERDLDEAMQTAIAEVHGHA
ncbi:MAG: YbjN domain-containing protein [Planktomarina sp.]